MPSSSIRSYNDFYAVCASPSLYAAPWWLNATCGQGNWDAIEIKDGKENASLFIPFCKTKIRGLSAVITPPMTQWLPVLSKRKFVSFTLQDFLESIPRTSILDLTIKPESNLLLPDRSFHVNIKYSYIISPPEARESARANYNEGLKRNLREAEKNYTISFSDDIQTFLKLCKSSFHHRKMTPPSWLEKILQEVVIALKENASGQIIMAYQDDRAIAGILIGWDSNTTYYLLGGRLDNEKGASAHALLLDRAIHQARQNNHRFDFEGSMNPGIANFFQSFGATPESYMQISKFSGLGKLWSLFH